MPHMLEYYTQQRRLAPDAPPPYPTHSGSMFRGLLPSARGLMGRSGSMGSAPAPPPQRGGSAGGQGAPLPQSSASSSGATPKGPRGGVGSRSVGGTNEGRRSSSPPVGTSLDEADQVSPETAPRHGYGTGGSGEGHWGGAPGDPHYGAGRTNGGGHDQYGGRGGWVGASERKVALGGDRRRHPLDVRGNSGYGTSRKGGNASHGAGGPGGGSRRPSESGSSGRGGGGIKSSVKCIVM